MSGKLLLLCPFCGGPARIKSGGPGNHYVSCDNCSAATNDVGYERAIELWNTRPALLRTPNESMAQEMTKENMLELADRLDFLVTASRPTIDGHIYLNGCVREALTDAVTKLRSQGGKYLSPNDPRDPDVDYYYAYIGACERLNAVASRCSSVGSAINPDLAQAINIVTDYADDLDAPDEVTAAAHKVCQALIDLHSPAGHNTVRQAVIEECVDVARRAYAKAMENYANTGPSGIAGVIIADLRALSATARSPATEDLT